MTPFESASIGVGSTHATLWEQELSVQTLFYFELRNDDTSSNGDDVDEFSIDIKPHEDSDWIEIYNQESFGDKFPLAADEQIVLSCVIDKVYSVRFTAASSDNNGQNVLMRGYSDAA